jgi:hypothetical protein
VRGALVTQDGQVMWPPPQKQVRQQGSAGQLEMCRQGWQPLHAEMPCTLLGVPCQPRRQRALYDAGN